MQGIVARFQLLKFNFKTSVLVSLFWGVSLSAQANLPASDAEFECFERRMAEQLLRDFNVNVQSFGGLELCDAKVDTKKLLNDFFLVKEGRFAGNERNLFIRNTVNAGNYYGWLKDMTRGVRRGHDIPYATAYNSGGYFTMQDGWAQLSTLGRVGTLIHEARHTAGYGHVICDQGPYQGAWLNGCDDTLAEGGSHGVEMEYYSRVVLQGQNFHPAYKQMARLMNLGRANFVFNDNPLRAQEAIVALTENEAIVVKSQGTARVNIPSHNENEFALKRSSFGASLFTPEKVIGLDLYRGHSETELRDEYSYFKLLLVRSIEKLVDMEEIDIGPRRYLVALSQDGLLYTYQFPNGRWSYPTQHTEVISLLTTTPDGQEGLFVLNKNGSIQPLNPQSLTLGRSISQSWPSEAIQFVKWSNDLLMLNRFGQVLSSKSNKQFEPLSHVHVQQMVRAPVYDAFEL